MAELLNRAYQRLNKVLDLAGSQVVNHIDTDQAFAVHDLTNVIQAELLESFEAELNLSFVGAAVQQGIVDFREVNLGSGAPEWDVIRLGDDDRSGVLGETNPIPTDWDIVITDLSMTSTADAVTLGMWWWSDGLGTGSFWPITNRFPNTFTLAGPFYPLYAGSNNPYYVIDPPFLLTAESNKRLYFYASASGADVWSLQAHGFAARPGVIQRPLTGGR